MAKEIKSALMGAFYFAAEEQKGRWGNWVFPQGGIWKPLGFQERSDASLAKEIKSALMGAFYFAAEEQKGRWGNWVLYFSN